MLARSWRWGDPEDETEGRSDEGTEGPNLIVYIKEQPADLLQAWKDRIAGAMLGVGGIYTAKATTTPKNPLGILCKLPFNLIMVSQQREMNAITEFLLTYQS